MLNTILWMVILAHGHEKISSGSLKIIDLKPWANLYGAYTTGLRSNDYICGISR